MAVAKVAMLGQSGIGIRGNGVVAERVAQC